MKNIRVLPTILVLLLLVVASSYADMLPVQQYKLLQENAAEEYTKKNYLEQGWSDAARQEFYYTTGGTQLLPYDWFVSLEQKDNTDPLVSDHNITQLHLVPNRNKADLRAYNLEALNPDGLLPVGLAITEYNKQKFVGITCAFCHTGQINYTTTADVKGDAVAGEAKKKRYTLYIDGGPSMQFNFRFLIELFGSLRATLADGDKFSRFAGKVWKMCVDAHLKDEEKAPSPRGSKPCGNRNTGDDDVFYHEKLKDQVTHVVNMLLTRARIDTIEWGFGRFDALGRGSSLVFGNLDPDNLRHANAPVSIPQIWGAWRYNVVQWSGLIRHPIARNIGQTVGVGAGLFEYHSNKSTPMPASFNPFASSTDVVKLQELEHLVRSLKPPAWPENIFGKINDDRAWKGKQLYADRCAHCHIPSSSPDASPTQKVRGQILKVNIIPQSEIGTDKLYLDNAGSRTVAIPDDLKDKFGGKGRLQMAKATEIVTTEILKQNQGKLKSQFQDISDNLWEPPRDKDGNLIIGYMARPHAAIWATPPFLHNGSVPTLYALLSPVEERPWCFLLGDLEFDPVEIGYNWVGCDYQSRPDNPYSGFNFNTMRPGNSNKGHEFTNTITKPDGTKYTFSQEECAAFSRGGKNGVIGCGLTKDEREAIIEYLKTCDLDAFPDKNSFDRKQKPTICREKIFKF